METNSIPECEEEKERVELLLLVTAEIKRVLGEFIISEDKLHLFG